MIIVWTKIPRSDNLLAFCYSIRKHIIESGSIFNFRLSFLLRLASLLSFSLIYLQYTSSSLTMLTYAGTGQNTIVSAGGHTALIPLLGSSAPQVSSLAVSALAGLAETKECAAALAESGSIPKVANIMSSAQVYFLRSRRVQKVNDISCFILFIGKHKNTRA